MTAYFSIWSQFYNTKEPEEAILEFEKDGLKYTELSSEHSISLLERKGSPAEIGREFANFCLQHSIKILQAHMIFPSDIVTDESVFDTLVRQMEMLDAMGVPCAVLHGDPMTNENVPYEEKLKRNVEALKKLLSLSSHTKVTLCLENLRHIFRGIDEILCVIDAVGSDRLAVCLDTGHLNITKTGTQRDFILKAGNRLRALHIANNDGKEDRHLAPFTGSVGIDFTEVVDALREINYTGLFNYEIGGESHNCPAAVKHIKYLGLKAGYDYLMGNLK